MTGSTRDDSRMVHRNRATRPLLVGIAWLFSLGACASQQTTILFAVDDPTGDVRLVHPDHPLIQAGTFDLERFTLVRVGDRVVAEVTFAAPVRMLRDARLAEDLTGDLLPQTVDIYLDTLPGEGRIHALPGRGFDVPAPEAWDWVLVVSSLADVSEPGLIRPLHLVAHGRTLRATFDGSKIPTSIAGVLVTVLATATSGEGRVRPVAPSGGDCQVWQDERCMLEGTGPPVLDATGDVMTGRPIALSYRDGERPRATPIPIVFKHDALLSVSPVHAGQLFEGVLVTVVDAAGTPLGTATVLSVVGDLASLRQLDGAVSDAATGVLSSALDAPATAPPGDGDQN